MSTVEEDNAQLEKFSYRIYNGYTLPINFENIREKIEHLEVFEDDVWVCGFPKSGTTWVQEMVWCICKDLDFEAAKELMNIRFFFLEHAISFLFEPETDEPDFELKSIDILRNMKRPRFIKTHLPWELLPKQITSFQKRPKIFHVVRNPMDVFISFYYFIKMLGLYNGGIEPLMQVFLENNSIYTPFEDNVLSYWKQRDEPNILCLKYENMKKDLSSVIDSVVEFLGKTLPDGGKDKLLFHLSFETMKKGQNTTITPTIEFIQKRNPSSDKTLQFIRSGKVGGYRSEMSEEAIERFKRQFLDKLEKAGITFPMI